MDVGPIYQKPTHQNDIVLILGKRPCGIKHQQICSRAATNQKAIAKDRWRWLVSTASGVHQVGKANRKNKHTCVIHNKTFPCYQYPFIARAVIHQYLSRHVIGVHLCRPNIFIHFRTAYPSTNSTH